ncbi:hypothetical protein GQ44DRAFT_825747 [Phaeosphaeriaceae sp. PMI808]|nr:hypothetical protein GQ44DRAFT_825747 [Phaeosphaeriaceae sp. PMI808]
MSTNHNGSAWVYVNAHVLPATEPNDDGILKSNSPAEYKKNMTDWDRVWRCHMYVRKAALKPEVKTHRPLIYGSAKALDYVIAINDLNEIGGMRGHVSQVPATSAWDEAWVPFDSLQGSVFPPQVSKGIVGMWCIVDGRDAEILESVEESVAGGSKNGSVEGSRKDKKGSAEGSREDKTESVEASSEGLGSGDGRENDRARRFTV